MPDVAVRRGTVAEPRTPPERGVWRRETVRPTARGRGTTHLDEFQVVGGARKDENRGVANHDRLSALDAAFLHLETDGAHMHVASILVFDGEAPHYDDLLETIE